MCFHPLHIVHPHTGQPVSVPCGKCAECHRRLQKDWVVRGIAEHKDAKLVAFVTLTYRDDMLPYNTALDDPDRFPVLRKVDFQLFMKRLRKSFAQHEIYLRFISCGEYGPQTFRPHYHAVLYFDTVFDIRVVTEIVDKAWGLGFVVVKPCDSDTVNYIVKYLTYKTELPECYDNFKPFRLVSKHFGANYVTPDVIARYSSLLDDLQVHPEAYKVRPAKDVVYSMPRYYKDRIYSSSEKAKIGYSIASRLKDEREQRLLHDRGLLCRQPNETIIDYERRRQEVLIDLIRNDSKETRELVNREKEAQRLTDKQKRKSKL